MSFSETVRDWFLKPMLTAQAMAQEKLLEDILKALKKTEANIMAETVKDIDAETVKLSGLEVTALKDVLAAIDQLKQAVISGQDVTTQVNNLIALEKPLQDLDAAAQANLAAPAPAADASAPQS